MGIEIINDHKARLVVYRGSDLAGKPIRYKKTVEYTSKRDLNRQYRLFETEVDNNKALRGSVTLSDIINDYIDARKSAGARETTLRGYRVVRERIAETLGDPKAKNVKPMDIDRWIRKLTEDKNYSPKTVRNTVSLLSSAYNRAVRLGELDRNPCERVELPKKERKEPITLDIETFIPFCSALDTEFDAEPDRVCAIELALFCGLRMSEILGLTVDNIGDGIITVNKSRHRVNTGDEIKDIVSDTKTKESARTIAIPDRLKDHLAQLRKRHLELWIRMPGLERSNFVILDYDGSPIHSNQVSWYLMRLEERHNLPAVTPHKLRHTHASLARYLGYDILDISSQLGHAEKSTTLDIYTHLFQDASASSRGIAHGIDELLSAQS